MGVFEFSLVSLLTTMLGNLAIGLLICIKAPRKQSSVVFLSFITTLTLWSLLSFFEDYQSLEPQVRFMLFRLDFFVAPFAAFLFFLFTNIFPSYKNIISKKLLIALATFTALFSLLSITTDIIINDIQLGQFGLIYRSGPLDTAYALYIILLIVSSLFILFKQRQLSKGIEKLQLSYIFIGTLVPAIAISFFSLLMFRALNYDLRVEFNDLTTLLHRIAISSTLATTIFTAYAILRHRLFGIRVLVGELIFWTSSAAMLFTSFYAVALLELKYIGSITSPPSIIINIFLAFFIALMLNAYGQKLRKVIKRHIINISFDPVQVKEQLLADISVITETEPIVHYLADTTHRLYCPTNQGILVAHATNDSDIKTFWKGYSPEQISNLENPDTINLLFDTARGRSTIPASQIIKNHPGSSLSKLLININIEIIIPLQYRDIHALYLLGPKTNNNAYTDEDLTLIEQLCYYTVLNLARTT